MVYTNVEDAAKGRTVRRQRLVSGCKYPMIVLRAHRGCRIRFLAQQVSTSAATGLFLRPPLPARSDECLDASLCCEQIKADMVTYTSDRFEEFREYALGMVKKGEAYMDDTPQVGRRSCSARCSYACITGQP